MVWMEKLGMKKQKCSELKKGEELKTNFLEIMKDKPNKKSTGINTN